MGEEGGAGMAESEVAKALEEAREELKTKRSDADPATLEEARKKDEATAKVRAVSTGLDAA